MHVASSNTQVLYRLTYQYADYYSGVLERWFLPWRTSTQVITVAY